MTNALHTSQTLPPNLAPPPPSERDLEIFKLAHIHHRTHDTIALDLGLSRRRVSQIVSDVRQWLAMHGTHDPEINTDSQRVRFARGLGRLQLHDVIQRAVHALNNAPAGLTTSCRTEGGGPLTRIVREQPPVDHRLLKTYLQAVNALNQLEERTPVPPPPTSAGPWTDPKIQNFLTDWGEENGTDYFTPDEYQDFVKQLTLTIQQCLAERSPGSGVVCGADSPPPTDLPPQTTPDPLPPPSPTPADPSPPSPTLNLETETLNSPPPPLSPSPPLTSLNPEPRTLNSCPTPSRASQIPEKGSATNPPLPLPPLSPDIASALTASASSSTIPLSPITDHSFT